MRQWNQFEYPPIGDSPPNTVIQLARDLIRFPSLTPITREISESSSDLLNYIEGHLARHGAKCQRLTFVGGHDKWGYPVDNLYAEWQFGKGSKHLCFMGHIDVVPPGDLMSWSKDPFGGILEDGWIYGRGATDMKGAVAAFCAAITQNIELLQDRSLRISLLITSDEEWAAINGTRKVLDWMKQTGKTIDAIIIGEPSSTDKLGSHIKIGRRGSLCGTLAVTGVQGHTAYPDLFDNPNGALSLANTILNAHRWEHDSSCFPPTNFETISLQSGNLNETSIIPSKATSSWNIRFTPRYQVDQINQILLNILTEPPAWARSHPDCNKLANVIIHSNTDTVAEPYYSKPSFLTQIAIRAVSRVTNEQPQLDAAGGTTDGRFVHEFFPAAQIIELGLPERGGLHDSSNSQNYGKSGGMHQIDERCRVKDIEDLLLIYQKIIFQFASSVTVDLEI